MRIILVIFVALLIGGCSRKDLLRGTLSNIIGHRVELFLDSMLIYQYTENTICMQSKDSIPYKCVVYIDTTDCSMCTLERMQLWNDFIPYEEAGKVRLYFILASRKDEANSLSKQLSHVSLRHDVYIDTNQIFMHKNAFIPPQKMYHTFLLDCDNNIVLVGDPIRNEKIEEIMLGMIGVEAKKEDELYEK